MAEAERIKALGEASETRRAVPGQPADDRHLAGRDGLRQPAVPRAARRRRRWPRSGRCPGWAASAADDDPLHAMTEVLTEEGYTAVLGTNCEQTYERYLRVGEQLRVTTALDSVAGPKNTAMGEGYFVTSRNTWYVGDGERVVATMLFRVLKFIPKERRMTRPPDGQPRLAVLLGRHRSGRAAHPECNACGALRLPARPGVPGLRRARPRPRRRRRRGTVFSYVVHRHPPVPGKELPIVIALIDLDEGVRMVGEVVDVADDEIEIGMPLQVDFRQVDDELTLPDLEASAMRTLEAGERDPRVEPADDADDDRQHRDRDPGLAGRPPRPRRRPGGRVEGHLHEHPDHQRAGREVRRRLGRPRRRDQGHRDPARRAGAPLRHADVQRRRHRRSRTASPPSTSSAGCRSATT